MWWYLFFFFKIDPPDEWSSNTRDMSSLELLPTCVTQSVQKLQSNCFNVVVTQSRPMTYVDFKAISETKAIEVNFTNFTEAEDIFWSQICVGEKIYGINIPTTLFGDETAVWNLDKFTKDQSNIHTKPYHRLLKVSVF